MLTGCRQLATASTPSLAPQGVRGANQQKKTHLLEMLRRLRAAHARELARRARGRAARLDGEVRHAADAGVARQLLIQPRLELGRVERLVGC